MQLIFSHASDRFETISKYGEWQAKEAGFRWDPRRRTWWTKDWPKAARLVKYADAELASKIETKVAAKREASEAARVASRATDANIDVPAPEGLAYLPYQKAGIAYALQRAGTLIGDEMGLGKTIQAIGVINADDSINRAVVICPASLRLNWKRELEKWLTRPLSVGVAEGPNWPEADIVVINYDILRRHSNALRAIEWDMLIADESHYLKNSRAIRTIQVLGKWHSNDAQRVEPINARRRLFLTGTPIVNRPIEMYPILKSINYKTFGNFRKYTARYCDARHNGYGWDLSGASNLDELQDKLRESCMVRRLKAEVLKDLPPKRRQVIELPPNGCARIVREEQSANKLHENTLKRLRVAVELAKASEVPADYDNAVDALRDGIRAHFEEMSKIRSKMAVAKIPYVIEHVREALDATTGKLVVFAHHHDVIDEIMGELGTIAVKLDGRDSMSARDYAVTRFQTDDAVRVFVGGIKAAGVGLTLTAAAHVVFAELDWVPGNISQAEDRCHRIGQVNSVLVQHLVLEGSLDATMAKVLVEKQDVIDRALDIGADDTRAERQSESDKPIDFVDAPVATKSVKRDRITTLAKFLTDEQIQEVHDKLKTLAGACDGARTLDGQGFNAFDTSLGKTLAWEIELTPKQAVLGAFIVRKYSRQVGGLSFQLKKEVSQ